MMVMEKIMRKKHLVASIALFIFLSFTLLLHKAESSRAAAGGGKHFVLVHGAGHGAWCWFKLVPLLRSYGHNVTTMDLAASGIDPRQLEDVRSTSDYFQPLTDFMAALPPSERVVLVAHSYGGIGISLAMERFPEKIAVAVFVTALMPGPSQNITELANRVDWTLATTLVRPFPLFPGEEISNTLILSAQNYGSVHRVFIIANEDKAITKDLQRSMIHKNPPKKVEVVTGADHMFMMSQPIQLSFHLQAIALKYS
ncbi:methyl jasmonate esterase 1-like isoform X2 [Malania oleifera]|uniref:methyl jasmonate esterase 1-like isoform X2 n=1 Tax=Malania oleifera TaxID=397392 RepID=UPI0025ADDD9E|nr:methyl jasmonate esterase 1-like isoform X2 [Malania oleifera]